MEFKEIIKIMKDGTKVRRRTWNPTFYIWYYRSDFWYEGKLKKEIYPFCMSDFEGDDWEEVQMNIKEKIKEIEDKSVNKRYKWTEEEINFLEENITKLKHKQIAEILKRTPHAVTTKVTRLRISPLMKFRDSKEDLK